MDLVRLLDKELKVRDGADHDFYHQFNSIQQIKYALVAYDNEVPVGCGAIKVFDAETMEVKRMFVPDAYRGKGIAGEILKSLEVWAAELSCTRCILETGLQQPEAIRLYEKSGYAIIPNYGQYEQVYNSICFEKRLQP